MKLSPVLFIIAAGVLIKILEKLVPGYSYQNWMLSSIFAALVLILWEIRAKEGK